MSYGSLQNRLAGNSQNNVAPEVGMGATVLHWTDRTAGTITDVSANGKTITVQEDTASRIDGLGMTDAQSYDYAPNPDGRTWTFTLRKNGRYVRKGDSLNGQRVLIGSRSTYHDYSF